MSNMKKENLKYNNDRNMFIGFRNGQFVKIDKSKNTHENYMIGFTDGTIKIGTTGRGTKRVTEIVREKLKNSNVKVFSYYMSNLFSKEDAFRFERDACYLYRSKAVNNSREWIRCTSENLKEDFERIRQTLSMLSKGAGVNRGEQKYD